MSKQKSIHQKGLKKYPLSKKHILFLHAFRGCYTTSALFKKRGKNLIKNIKSLQKLANFNQVAQVFLQENCFVQQLHKNGLHIL